LPWERLWLALGSWVIWVSRLFLLVEPYLVVVVLWLLHDWIHEIHNLHLPGALGALIEALRFVKLSIELIMASFAVQDALDMEASDTRAING